MTKDLTKRASEMLLKGATMLSEPCPYCTGVRIMKDGYALCIGCGREPEKKMMPEKVTQEAKPDLEGALEKKIQVLAKELEQEKDHEKQQNILKTINSLLETIEKIKDKG